MPGKKQPLNSKIRQLLARIQREFHFPKVYAIRCSISSETHPIQAPVSLQMKRIPSFNPECHAYRTDFEPEACQATIAYPQCHTSQPLEEYATNIRSSDCEKIESIVSRTIPIAMASPATHLLSDLSVNTKCRRENLSFVNSSIKSEKIDFKATTRTNTRRIHDEGMRFYLTLMKDLPMRMVIRHRTEALRRIKHNSKDIDFIGLCALIPPAPIQFLGLEMIAGQHFAHGRIKGVPNPYIGNQSWILYRVRSTGDINALAIRKEE